MIRIYLIFYNLIGGIQLIVFQKTTYGVSMVFAIAENEELARKQIENAPAYEYVEHEISMISHNIKLGPPLRIVKCPCAEWHEWAE